MIPSFYNAADQELYKKYQYIPQEKYRLGLNLPTDAPATPPGGGGIVNTNAFANSGGGGNNGFSVYNADPNTITNMNPNMNALQDARYDNELSYVGKKNQPANPNIIPIANFDEVFGPKTFTDSLGKERTIPGEERFSFPGSSGSPSNSLYSTRTEAIKNMEMYPDYYGMDTIGDRFELNKKGELVMDSEGNYIRKNQPSKAAELIGKGINLIPGMGLVKAGATFIGDFANRYLPVNRRAIMENQLGVDGVMVNDIGQIVVGRGREYNTPEGIMAGYNVSAMDDESFTGRQDVMRNTLDQKYGLSKEQIDGLIDGSLTEEEMEDINKQAFNKTLNRPSDIISKIRNTEIARKNFNNTTGKTDEIVNIKTDTKANNNNINNNDGGGGTYIGGGASLEDAGGTYDGGMHGAEGGFENTGGFSPGSQENSPGHPSNRANGGLMYAKGGRAGYFYGGRVSVMKGGLASIL